jgi:hypothetical protein
MAVEGSQINYRDETNVPDGWWTELGKGYCDMPCRLSYASIRVVTLVP